jgi:hypothetical protein
MLFHVTAKHSIDDCNMLNEEVKQALQEFLPTLPSLCMDLGIKLHSAVTGHPEHVFYFLVEADDHASLCTFLCSIPLKQEFEIKPVRTVRFN